MNLQSKNINGKSTKSPHAKRLSSSRTGLPVQLSALEEDQLSPAELAEIWARRAEILAQEPPTAATGQRIVLLVFRLNGERYGIDVANVREIYPLEQLTPVPRTPDFVAGVFSARGRILSVIDLRAFLGLPSPIKGQGQSEVDQARIIVVTNTNLTSETVQIDMGILTDDVIDIYAVFSEEIEPPLTTQAGIRANYIRGVTADLLVVLDLNALLNDKQLIIKDEL
ncbi:MAG TPA: chemotaxis protein CheW [Anaerolineae bacterium]|nr:chemotaxis protein CheW [Anaerolineae bacterium]